jgi:hypothetical protein
MDFEKILSTTHPVTKITCLLVILQSCGVYMRWVAPSQLVLPFPNSAFDVSSPDLALLHHHFLPRGALFFPDHQPFFFVV